MLVNRLSENPIRDPSPYVRRWKQSGGGGAVITGVVQEQGVASTGDFIGLTWVDILVITASPGRESLIATEQRVYDHAGCILDLDDLLGYHVWASEKRAATLDTSKDCDVLTPPFWSADNRCCDPDTATYRSCT